MTATTSRQTVVARNDKARVGQAEARRVFATILGRRSDAALAALRFSAGTACAPVARVIEQALAEAARLHGMSADRLAVSDYAVGDGESVTRVRRQAHGRSDWITTTTTSVQVELSPIRYQARSEQP